MTTHQATEPHVVAEYFNRWAGPQREHAIVAQVFVQGKGWRDYPIRKRVSTSWARDARADGVESVALASGGHRADFGIKELTRRG